MKKRDWANLFVYAAGRALARAARCAAVAVCLAAAGCGSELADVSGTVTLDGQPLPRGTVVFQGDKLASGYGEIRSDGTFEIRTGDQQGLKPGKYRVTVTAYQTGPAAHAEGEVIPELLTPKRYNNPDTSDLTAEVKPGGGHFDFKLKR
jgi:hypothetical protein